jgi:hypothetical protein
VNVSTLKDLIAKKAALYKERNKVLLQIDALKKSEVLIKRRIDIAIAKIDRLENNCYYVYIVFVDGVPKYVGKGTGDRYKHAVSGSSSVKELNKDFFDGKYIEVRIVFGQRNMTEKCALQVEQDVILTLKEHGLYNKRVLPDANCLNTDMFENSEFAISNKVKPHQEYMLDVSDK